MVQLRCQGEKRREEQNPLFGRKELGRKKPSLLKALLSLKRKKKRQI
jgi:hypothetical protein